MGEDHLFLDLVDKYGRKGEISVANAVHYDTKVIFKGDYDVHLAGTVGSGNRKAGARQPSGSDATGPNSSAGNGQVGAGSVPDGQRQGARN